MTVADIQIVHLQPGRVRLKSKQLRSMPGAAQTIRDALQALSGMRSVEINPLTGSVLLTYDRQTLAADGALLQVGSVVERLFPNLDRGTVAQWLKDTAR
jgi:hypothetical protein